LPGQAKSLGEIPGTGVSFSTDDALLQSLYDAAEKVCRGNVVSAVTCTAFSLGFTGPITVREGTMILSFPASGGLCNAPITIDGGATLAVASTNAPATLLAEDSIFLRVKAVQP
jgi:hypothetical protein